MLLAYVSINTAAIARLPGLLTLGPLVFFGIARRRCRHRYDRSICGSHLSVLHDPVVLGLICYQRDVMPTSLAKRLASPTRGRLLNMMYCGAKWLAALSISPSRCSCGSV